MKTSNGSATGGRAWIIVATALAGGCGGGELDGAADDAVSGPDAASTTPECFSPSECPVGWSCNELGFCVPPSTPPDDAGVPPPPEVEYEYGPPVSSRRYVWVAMTDQDSVAKIDGETLEVTSVAVGEEPRRVVALPGTDIAVVLDSINGAATMILPAAGSQLTDAEPTLPRLNMLAASPSGRHAVAYFDLAQAIADAGSQEAVGETGSFQQVTVVGLETGGATSVDLVVGYRPREVEFDAAGRRAFVITDDGISIIDLDQAIAEGPSIIPPIRVTPDPFDDGAGLEVEVVPDGDLAVVREAGEPWLRAVSLTGATAGQMWDATLPGVPSDLEMSPDGRRAYAVLREQSELAVVDIPEDILDPSGIDYVDLADATLGSLSLSADGRRAASYTNAILDERLTIIELDRPGYPHRTFPLRKAVRAIGFDPSGQKVLVIHAKKFGDPEDTTDPEEIVDRKYGYSAFDVATGFAALYFTDVDPGMFAFAPGELRAYVCLDGGDAEGAVAEVHEIDLDSGVVYVRELGTPPEAVGVLPDSNKAFVSQRHPLGRVTFIDVVDTGPGQARTLTGFDLNSQIID